MNKLKEKIKESLVFFKENILKITIIVGLIFILSVTSSYLFFYENEKVAMNIVEEFVKATEDMVKLENGNLALAIILNNIRACIISVLLGFIPFLFLTIFVLLINAGLIGAVFQASSIGAGVSLWKTIIFGILPHGILELPALFISMALSIFLCLFLTKKILKLEKAKFGKTLLNVLLNVIIIVIPLLLVAGLIEGFITPILITKFLK